MNLHALVGADLQVSPGKRIEKGVILIRNGKIEKVGEGNKTPPGYRNWDMTGKTIYAGFIDPYLLTGAKAGKLLDLRHDQQHLKATADLSFYGTPSTRPDPGEKGPGFEVSGVHPERKGIDEFQPDEPAWKNLRKHGFTVAHLAPSEGILRGTGPCVLLRDGNPNDLILKRKSPKSWPLIRSAKNNPHKSIRILSWGIGRDQAGLYRYRACGRKIPIPEAKTSTPPYFPHIGIRSLQKVLDKKNPFPVWIESGSCLMENRAMSLGREFGFHPVLIATGDEWRRPDLALSKNHSYVSNLLFPALSKLPEEEDWEQISSINSGHGTMPGNPSLISRKAKSLSFTTTGVSLGEFHRNLIQAIERGLSEKEALAALTTNPARICGIEKSSGTLERESSPTWSLSKAKPTFPKEPKSIRPGLKDALFNTSSTETKRIRPKTKTHPEAKAKRELPNSHIPSERLWKALPPYSLPGSSCGPR